MQLIAGLGNPGEKYQDNPHNIGFRTLDQLMKALDLKGFQRRFNSEFLRTLENGQVTLMLKPETYMNRSGEAIAECARYFKIPSEKILVISDDLDLPAGKHDCESPEGTAATMGSDPSFNAWARTNSFGPESE